MDRETRISAALLILIAVAALGYEAGVLGADRVPLIYDPQELSRSAILLGRGLAHGDNALLDEFFRLSGESAYPPLIHYAALPVTLLFHNSLRTPVASFAFFNLLLLISVFAIGRDIAGPKVGALAAALAALTPGLDGFSRVFMTDYPLAALFAAACAILFSTDSLSSVKFALALGLVIGAGILTKQSFPLYAAVPFAVYAAPAIARASTHSERARRAGLLALAVLLGTAIGLTWLYPRIQTLIVERQAIDAYTHHVEPRSYDMADYISLLVRFGSGPILATLAALGMAFAEKSSKTVALTAGVLAPLVFLPMIFPLLTPRYILPLLPLCAVLAALGIRQLAGRHFAPVAIVCVGVCAGWFGWTSWSTSPGPLGYDEMHARFQETGMRRPQFTSDESVSLAETVIENHKSGAFVMLLDSPVTEALQGRLWEWNLLYEVENFFENAGIGIIPPSLADSSDILTHLKNAEMILYAKEAPNGPKTYAPTGGVPEAYAHEVFETLRVLQESFVQLTQMKSSEGLTLVLLIRR